MIKNYKIGSKDFNIDFKQEISNIILKIPKDSLTNGLSDQKIRNNFKTHIHNKVYNVLDLGYIVKYFYESEINNVVDDIVDNVHIMLILKNKE